MLEQLLNSLKAEIGGHLTSQADLPAEQLDDVISSIELWLCRHLWA